MTICQKCQQPEIRYDKNRCHSCYLILRRRNYARKDKLTNRQRKIDYRASGHPCWVRGLLNTFKRKRSKKLVDHVEPSKEDLRRLANRLALDLAKLTHCPYTGEKLILGQNVSLDHKIPRSRRPDLAYEYSNLQWVSKTYNRCKSDLTDAEFRKLCRTVLDNWTA
jgi:5-methylcytosine-specific restriction endonuclease McrA